MVIVNKGFSVESQYMLYTPVESWWTWMQIFVFALDEIKWLNNLEVLILSNNQLRVSNFSTD